MKWTIAPWFLAFGLVCAACDAASDPADPVDLAAASDDGAPAATDSGGDVSPPAPDPGPPVDTAPIPDAVEPEPDAVDPPDAVPPTPDVVEPPEPDAVEPPPADVPPTPDAVEPEPDAELPPTPDAPVTGVDPYGAGAYQVLESTIDVPGAGGTSFSCDLYVPDGDGPYPGVVFAPGFQLGADSFAPVGQHLAAHGFVALVPTFGDTLLGAIDHADLAAHISAYLDWLVAAAGDSSSVLFGRLDVDALAAGGHSRGGKVAILAATSDARIKASFNVDPVDAVGGGPFPTPPSPENPSVTPELMGDFTIPAGFIGSGLGKNETMGQACAPVDENYHEYFTHAASTEAFEYLLADAGHNDFAVDLPAMVSWACTAGSDPEGARAFTQATMVAFYQVFLRGDDSYRPWVDGAALPEAVGFDQK